MAAPSSNAQLSAAVWERYNSVIANPQNFLETLQEFHAANGTRFMVPVIGRKDLDLHQFFVEVTSRGGIEQVIRERRLKEVARTMNLPCTATNVSFMLRRYYYTLLYNYEQVYFFGADGANTRTTAPMENSPQILAEELREPENIPKVEAASSHRRGKSPVEVQPEASSLILYMKGTPVVGIVDVEFSEGYYVSVTIGDEKLKGIIFKTREQPPFGQLPEPSGNVANNRGINLMERRHQQHEKTSKVRKINPTDSYIYKSGYSLFCKEQRAKLKPLYGANSREMSAKIDNLWKHLSVNEKTAYQENGLQFEKRYKSEMKEYRERMKLRISDILSEAVPASRAAVLPSSAPEVERDESLQEVEPDESHPTAERGGSH